MKNTLTRNKEIPLESRVEKLEEILQLVIQPRQSSTIPIRPHFQVDQVDYHQHTGEVWSSNAGCNPEGQSEGYQLERQPYREWSRAKEYQDAQSYIEPYPSSLQLPSWPMEYPNHQPYPDHQDHEFDPPTYQTDCFSYFPSLSSQLYQTFSSETGDHFPSWSKEDWQSQNTPYYPYQTCPDQPQYLPHQQQSFKPTLKEDHCANSVEKEIEAVTALQQNM